MAIVRDPLVEVSFLGLEDVGRYRAGRVINQLIPAVFKVIRSEGTMFPTAIYRIYPLIYQRFVDDFYVVTAFCVACPRVVNYFLVNRYAERFNLWGRAFQDPLHLITRVSALVYNSFHRESMLRRF